MNKQMEESFLALEDGTVFRGWSPEWQTEDYPGEVVFTTGMTGYPETLTDPSYAGQIVVFTFPLIGNYGIPQQDEWESQAIHARGVVVSEACQHWSHHSGIQPLSTWLKEQKVPLIAGVDTRALTKKLRSHGTLLGALTKNPKSVTSLSHPHKEHLVAQVSNKQIQNIGTGEKTVIAIDCGMKQNILRSLAKYPIKIRRVPFDYDFTEEPFDGVFLSNGPGDPVKCQETLTVLQKAIQKEKPIFGICLGTQLLALAANAKTYKLPFGHRGHNQPCIDLETEQCYITSQNHGYAVQENTLPKGWKITFRNLNDQSIEGISHREKPFFAVQFHPEAAPGPTDTQWLFEKFYRML